MPCECDEMPDEDPCRLDLVWDDDLNATAFTADGRAIRVGAAASLSPQRLLALAASSGLMMTFLELAAEAGVPVQGYVSSARLRETTGGEPELALVPCVVVLSDEDCARIERLWDDAVRRSPTLRLLGAHVQVEPTVRVVPPV